MFNIGLYFLSSLFSTILFSLVFAKILFRIVTVIGSSMRSTLHSRDRVLVLQYWPSKWFKVGQIVVGNLGRMPSNFFSLHLQNQPTKTNFVKRLIGLPGDKVIIHISQIPENVQSSLASQCDNEGNVEWVIPQGHCFVRGDSPTTSIDSTQWGPIPLSTLWGVMLLKLPRKSNARSV